MKPTITFAALALASLATPATAQVPSDATCVLVSNLFARQSTDATQKKVAENALYYYFGKLDARMSGAQIQAAMRKVGPTITAAKAGPVMTACARTMQVHAAAFQGAASAAQPAKK